MEELFESNQFQVGELGGQPELGILVYSILFYLIFFFSSI